MLRKPRQVDRNARGVGIQELKLDEKLTKKEFVGVQYFGRLVERNGEEGDSEDIAKGSGRLIEIQDCVGIQAQDSQA